MFIDGMLQCFVNGLALSQSEGFEEGVIEDGLSFSGPHRYGKAAPFYGFGKE